MPQLHDLRVDRVSLVERAAVRDPQNKSEPRRFLIWKREGDTSTEGAGDMPQTMEEMQTALKKAEDERAAAVEAQQKAEKALADREAAAKNERESEDEDDDDGDDSKTQKSELPKAVRDQLAKQERDMEERIKKAEEKASESEKIAKEERDRRVLAEHVKKAEELSALPQKPAEFGAVLKNASEKLSADEFSALESVLKGADDTIRRGDVFKEFGTSSQGGADDAFSQLQRKAEEIRKSDSSLSAEQALQKAMEGDRALAAAYLKEQQGA